jgi:hypothetical protein
MTKPFLAWVFCKQPGKESVFFKPENEAGIVPAAILSTTHFKSQVQVKKKTLQTESLLP